MREIKAKFQVRARGSGRVLKVVGKAVAPFAKIYPGVSILMDEERRLGGDVVLPEEMVYGSLPRVPGLRGNAEGGRTDGEQKSAKLLASGKMVEFTQDP